MRYGLENNRNWIKDGNLFPVQSSVLDEEALLSEVLTDYRIPEPVSCRFLSRGDSDIYRVRAGEENFYLKIYRPPKSLESTEAEARFVWVLSESGIPVVKPVHRRDNHFAYQTSAPEGIRAMLLYEEAPPPLPLDLDEELSSAIGEIVALVHNVSDAFETSFGFPEIDINTSLRENVFYTSRFLLDPEKTYLQDVSIHLGNFIQKQARSSAEFGLCHADLVLSNIRLTHEGTITLFDFGNVMKTWRAFELAIVFWSVATPTENPQDKLWKAFLQGYKSNRPLPETLSEILPAMLVLRQMGFLGGNCATLPLRLGTEPFESGFIEKEMKRLRKLVEESGILN